MTFEEKLENLILSIADRRSPPSNYKEYLLLDFIEFYALFYGEEVPKSEVLDYLDDNDFNIVKCMTTSSWREQSGDSNKDELDNQKEYSINYFFDCLKYRHNLLSDKYPFTIDTNSIELRDELSTEQKCYLVLLMGSMLNVFIEFQSDLTSEFEDIVEQALVNLFPKSKVKSFGKNSDYAGTAQEKIRALADDMNIKLNEELVQDISGNQDKGLDLIVWQPFKDKIPNMNISLVQCACGKNWKSKFDDAKRYKGYFNHHLVNDLNYIFASSYAFVTIDRFFQADEIFRSDSLILDRLRILEVIDGESLGSIAESSFMLVDKMISHQIDFG